MELQNDRRRQLQNAVEKLKRLRKNELRQVASNFGLSPNKSKEDLKQEILEHLITKQRKLLKNVDISKPESCHQSNDFHYHTHEYYACLQVISEQVGRLAEYKASQDNCYNNFDIAAVTSQIGASDPLIQVVTTIGIAKLNPVGPMKQSACLKFDISKETFCKPIQEDSGKRNQEVIIRCFHIDSEAPSLVSGHAWPEQCKIFVNGNRVHLIQHHTSHIGEYEVKNGFDIPAKISHLLREGENIMSLVAGDSQTDYCILIEVVILESVSQMAESIICSSNLERRDCLGIYRSQAVDDVVHVPVICPLTKKTMAIAARGLECEHLAGFDLVSFLKMNQLSSTFRWLCPICSKKIEPQLLKIDSFLTIAISMLSKSGLHSVNRICVTPATGKWSVCNEQVHHDTSENLLSDGLPSPPSSATREICELSPTCFSILDQDNAKQKLTKTGGFIPLNTPGMYDFEKATNMADELSLLSTGLIFQGV